MVNPATRDGATAIAAVFFSVLGAAAQIASVAITAIGVALLLGPDSPVPRDALPGWFFPYIVAISLVELTIAVLLTVGGVQTLQRRLSARMVIVGAGTTAAVVTVIGVGVGRAISTWSWNVIGKAGYGGLIDAGFWMLGYAPILGAIKFVLVLTAAALVLLPSTRRWCLARDDRSVVCLSPPP